MGSQVAVCVTKGREREEVREMEEEGLLGAVREEEKRRRNGKGRPRCGEEKKKREKRKRERDGRVVQGREEEKERKKMKKRIRDTWCLVSGWEGIMKSTTANWVTPHGRDRILFIKSPQLIYITLGLPLYTIFIIYKLLFSPSILISLKLIINY
jgi:hypothetical protein